MGVLCRGWVGGCAILLSLDLESGNLAACPRNEACKNKENRSHLTGPLALPAASVPDSTVMPSKPTKASTLTACSHPWVSSSTWTQLPGHSCASGSLCQPQQPAIGAHCDPFEVPSQFLDNIPCCLHCSPCPLHPSPAASSWHHSAQVIPDKLCDCSDPWCPASAAHSQLPHPLTLPAATVCP